MSRAESVTVLFARRDSHYKSMPGIDVYDIDRDARTFPGGTPVVAHPPCRAWGMLAHMAKPRPDERELAPWAIQQIRKFGGVLEHPKGSRLWKEISLPLPGEFPDEFGGFSLDVDQYDWGHLAHKATRLYVCGCSIDDIPQMPPKNLTPTRWSIAGESKAGGIKGTHRISDRLREATPPAFASFLIEIARRCCRIEAVS